ncbi:MAG: hypothetical protein AAFR96_12250 [Planctomycetota bacterium]
MKLLLCTVAALSLVLPAAGQESLADELASTLDAMSAAAIVGDAEAYLEHVATDEPEFLIEQRAWAKDIERIAPDVLRYELTTVPEIGDDDGEATAGLRITWNTPNHEGDDRQLEIPARFVMQGGAWHFGGRDWLERDAQGLRVLHANGAGFLARQAAGFWPDIKEHVEEGFETTLDHPQVIKMYPTMLELQFSIFPAYVEPLGGWNEPGESIKLLGRETSPEGLKTVIAHEYGHALTFAMGGPDIPLAVERAHAMPWWLLEGTAELAAAKYSSGYRRAKRAVRRWHANGELPGWDRISNFYETDPADYRYVYTQGLHFAAYVSDRFGRTARNELLRTMMKGATLDEACREVFGLPFDELDADWRGSISEDD